MIEIGVIQSLCVSEQKGTPKDSVPGVTLRADHGIEGDAHAGFDHRQLSALAFESVERMARKLPDLAPGDFGENLVTVGVDWQSLSVGDRVRLGHSVIAEVTQHGKECHTRCAIYYSAGECIMPTEGVFLRVLSDGTVAPGDSIFRISDKKPQKQ